MKIHTYRDLVIYVPDDDGQLIRMPIEPVIEIPRPGPVPSPPLPHPTDTVMFTYHTHGRILIPCVWCGGQLEPEDDDQCQRCRDERDA